MASPVATVTETPALTIVIEETDNTVIVEIPGATSTVEVEVPGPVGPMGPEGPEGPKGDRGERGIDGGAIQGTGDLHYIHIQSLASDTWAVEHNLGKYPSVTVLDSALSQVEGDVNYTDNSSLTIQFTAAFSGTATLN